MSKQYRQGDVLFVQVDRLPPEEKYNNRYQPVPDRVVAKGEATGHHHKVTGNATVTQVGWRELYASVAGEATLVHEEHGEIALDPGIYHVVVQREYQGRDPWRNVRD